MYTIGIEFSTQSVKLVVLDLKDCCVAFSSSFDYDATFPAYNTRGGVLPSDEPGIRHTSPLMLIEALDRAFEVMVAGGVKLSLVSAVKVDGMQHCTVYAGSDFPRKLKTLDHRHALVDQLTPCITRMTSPIWEDRSPVAEAAYLTDALEPHGGIAHLTGNRAELRFPASQVLRWSRKSPEEYERTTSIQLLSAFITSMLVGGIVPVDTGDGWGSNLNHLDTDHPGWSDRVLSAAKAFLNGHGIRIPLADKLGRMNHYDALAGVVGSYFVQKYGIAPTARVLVGTGDNPATLLGCGGSAVISLGSSYTVNGVMGDIIPSNGGEYNVFGFARGKAMALSVFTNGGKVHETFLGRYLHLPEYQEPGKADWEKYAAEAGSLRLADEEKLMLPYLLEESVPLRKEGIIREDFSDEDAHTNIRALHLSQVLAMKCHSDHIGDVDELCIVGGGSGSPVMRQWIADAFGARTYSIPNADSAAPFGCALSGAVTSLGISYSEASERFLRLDDASVCRPIPENAKVMDGLVKRYRNLERSS